MDPELVFVGFLFAAMFGCALIWAVYHIRCLQEGATELNNRVILAEDEKTRADSNLARLSADYEQQRLELSALYQSAHQQQDANQALRAQLSDVEAKASTLQQQHSTEMERARELGERLAVALAAVNDVSQSIIDMAQRHSLVVKKLTDGNSNSSEAIEGNKAEGHSAHGAGDPEDYASLQTGLDRSEAAHPPPAPNTAEDGKEPEKEDVADPVAAELSDAKGTEEQDAKPAAERVADGEEGHIAHLALPILTEDPAHHLSSKGAPVVAVALAKADTKDLRTWH